MIEETYGIDHLHLVLAKGYLGKLLGNARVVRYLAQHHQEILTEFQTIAEIEAAAPSAQPACSESMPLMGTRTR